MSQDFFSTNPISWLRVLNMPRVLHPFVSLWLILATSVSPPTFADGPKTLPGSRPLTTTRPLVEVMVEGINRFSLRELAASPARRSRKWTAVFPVAGESAVAIQRKLTKLRNQLQRRIGIVDRRLTDTPNQHHEFQRSSR